jgi:two-component system, NtrC family, response regulator HydG
MATILIIDDNETIREGLAHTVRKMGHEALLAGTGEEGVAQLKGREVDFVITDLRMEGWTGSASCAGSPRSTRACRP